MPRLTEVERQKLMADYNGSYEEVLLLNPSFEIVPGFGLLQLRDLEGTYNAKVTAIEAIELTGMPAKRAERDALFGTRPDDTDGIWAYLKLYKSTVGVSLRKNHPLKKTVPNLGEISPGSYDHILSRFGEHWALVNAALLAQGQMPMTLGPITLDELVSRRAQIKALAGQIDETVLTRLAVMRAEREEIFGDVREDEREETSIIARLEAFANKVQRDYLGQPIANTLAPIFPDGGASLPRFPFNFKQTGAQVTVWWEAPANVAASVVFLKEGAFEETRAVPVGVALKVTFDGVGVQDELDEVELRSDTGKTLAHGRFDASLVEPV